MRWSDSFSPETVIAEKLHAIVVLGSRNSRMKDYFDLHALAKGNTPKAAAIARAIAATFERRRTQLPERWPVGLTDEFANDATKCKQWQAFLDKNRLAAPALGATVEVLRELLDEPLALARQKNR